MTILRSETSLCDIVAMLGRAKSRSPTKHDAGSRQADATRLQHTKGAKQSSFRDADETCAFAVRQNDEKDVQGAAWGSTWGSYHS